MDVRTDQQIPPVFYRTLSPSRPLPKKELLNLKRNRSIFEIMLSNGRKEENEGEMKNGKTEGGREEGRKEGRKEGRAEKREKYIRF